MGRGTTRPHFGERGVRILAYKIPADPVRGPWEPQVINEELHVAHNFAPTDLDRDGKTDILVASFEGVSWLSRERRRQMDCQAAGRRQPEQPAHRAQSRRQRDQARQAGRRARLHRHDRALARL